MQICMELTSNRVTDVFRMQKKCKQQATILTRSSGLLTRCLRFLRDKNLRRMSHRNSVTRAGRLLNGEHKTHLRNNRPELIILEVEYTNVFYHCCCYNNKKLLLYWGAATAGTACPFSVTEYILPPTGIHSSTDFSAFVRAINTTCLLQSSVIALTKWTITIYTKRCFEIK